MTGESPGRSPIRIEVLGPFRVLDGEGIPVEIPRGKLTGLLAYLAVETHGVERDSLEAVLWPDASPRARRHSLRQALYSLRKALDVDPFVVEERVRLDDAVCSIDYREFRDTLWRDDPERCLALVRGIPFTDVPPDLSVAFEHWLERRRADALQRLARLAEALGREALEAGDEVTVRRTLRLGVRAGLKEDALTAAIYGPHAPRPSWAAATVGASGLETLVYRARGGLPSMVALVLETTDGWARRALTNRVAELPVEGRPALVVLERGDGEGDELATLLADLLELPGGAAVREGTVGAVHRLRTAEGLAGVEEGRADVEAALADALDAVLHEQALVLMVRVADLRFHTAGFLARAMALQGGEGLTVAVVGESEQGLSALPVQALVQAGRELRHVREIGGPDAPRGGTRPSPPPGTSSSDGGSTAEEGTAASARSRRHVAILAAAALVLFMVGARVVLSGEDGPLTSYDVLFCSARSGIPQYYRWSARTSVVERFSLDTAAYLVQDGATRCRGETVVGSGDSVRLAGRSGERFGWRSHPDVRSRGDLAAAGTLAAPSDEPAPPVFVGEGDEVLQYDSGRG